MRLEHNDVLEKSVFNPTAAVFVPRAIISNSVIQRYILEGFVKRRFWDREFLPPLEIQIII